MESERIRRHWARQLTHASLFRGVMAVIPEIASQGRAGSVLPCAVSPACHPQRLENVCSMRQTSGVTTENYVGKKKIKEKQRKRFVIEAGDSGRGLLCYVLSVCTSHKLTGTQ